MTPTITLTQPLRSPSRRLTASDKQLIIKALRTHAQAYAGVPGSQYDRARRLADQLANNHG